MVKDWFLHIAGANQAKAIGRNKGDINGLNPFSCWQSKKITQCIIHIDELLFQPLCIRRNRCWKRSQFYKKLYQLACVHELQWHDSQYSRDKMRLPSQALVSESSKASTVTIFLALWLASFCISICHTFLYYNLSIHLIFFLDFIAIQHFRS